MGLLEPLDGSAEAVFQRDVHFGFENGAHLGVVGDATRDVFVARTVDGLLGDEFDRGAGAGNFDHGLGELENGGFAVDADVEDIAHGFGQKSGVNSTL